MHPEDIIGRERIEAASSRDRRSTVRAAASTPGTAQDGVLLTYSAGSGRTLELVEEPSKWCFWQAVLEHVDAVEQIYASIASALAPGGFASQCYRLQITLVREGLERALDVQRSGVGACPWTSALRDQPTASRHAPPGRSRPRGSRWSTCCGRRGSRTSRPARSCPAFSPCQTMTSIRPARSSRPSSADERHPRSLDVANTAVGDPGLGATDIEHRVHGRALLTGPRDVPLLLPGESAICHRPTGAARGRDQPVAVARSSWDLTPSSTFPAGSIHSAVYPVAPRAARGCGHNPRREDDAAAPANSTPQDRDMHGARPGLRRLSRMSRTKAPRRAATVRPPRSSDEIRVSPRSRSGATRRG